MGERKVVKEFDAKIKQQVPGEGSKDIEQKFAVYEPNINDYREAKKVYNTVLNNALLSDAPLRGKLDDVLRRQGMWDDTKQAKLTSLQQELIETEKKLAGGGILKTEAKKASHDMARTRVKMAELLAPRTQLDGSSAEGQADNEQFNYLVSACVVYNDTKKAVFSSLEDYLNRSGEEVAFKAAQILANSIYGVDDQFEKNLPENRFLVSFGYMNKDLQLINEDGELVDEEDNLVDEEGNFIDKDGKRVDKFGNHLDKEGDYLVEFKPFLDDDGNAVEGTWNYGVNRKTKTEVKVAEEKPDEKIIETKAEVAEGSTS